MLKFRRASTVEGVGGDHMFIGLGVTDSGYAAELLQGRYSLTHEVSSYRGESFTTDGGGVEYSGVVSRWVSVAGRARIGYEHHYRSEYYATSYVVLQPEAILRSRHDVVAVQLAWTPVKGFYRLTRQGRFDDRGVRVQPSVSLSVLVNLDYSVYTPSVLNQPIQKSTKSLKKGK